MKTIQEQIKSARREVAMRKRVYPRSVEYKSMTADACRHEIECMEAIVETLEGVEQGKFTEPGTLL